MFNFIGRHKLKNRAGITLTEIIIVIGIIAILAAVGVPSLLSFLERGRQINRTNVARTMYLGMQHQLTRITLENNLRMLTAGYPRDPANPSGVVPANKQVWTLLNINEANTPGFADEENRQFVTYVSKPAFANRIAMAEWLENDANAEQIAFFNLLDEIVLEKSLLEDAILMEYNIRTGVVLSIFYGDDARQQEFAYAEEVYDDTGILLRRADERELIFGARGMEAGGYEFAEERRQGYYGVAFTGVDLLDIDDPELVNIYDGLDRPLEFSASTGFDEKINVLYAEFNVPTLYGGADALYTFEIVDITNGNVVVMSHSGVPLFNDNPILNYTDFFANIIDSPALFDADLVFFAGAQAYEMYGVGVGGGFRYVWVIDYVNNDVEQPHSLGVKYPGLNPANLRARLRVNGLVINSNRTQHSHFYGTTRDDLGDPMFDIRSARHLNNIRYALQDHQLPLTQRRFWQTRNIDMDTLIDESFSSTSNFLPIGRLIDADGNLSTVPFTGEFTASAGVGTANQFRIENLRLDTVIRNPGSNTTAVMGTDIGLFAQTNGTIKSVSLWNVCIIADTGTNVGAIAAQMDGGIIQESNSYANIRVMNADPAKNVGGLVGIINGGTLEQSFNGGFFDATAGLGTDRISFTPDINNQNPNMPTATGSIIANGGHIGGLVGQNSGIIQQSFNNARVNILQVEVTDDVMLGQLSQNPLAFGDPLDDRNKDLATNTLVTQLIADEPTYIGGIVGLNHHVVRQTYATNYVPAFSGSVDFNFGGIYGESTATNPAALSDNFFLANGTVARPGTAVVDKSRLSGNDNPVPLISSPDFSRAAGYTSPQRNTYNQYPYPVLARNDPFAAAIVWGWEDIFEVPTDLPEFLYYEVYNDPTNSTPGVSRGGSGGDDDSDSEGGVRTLRGLINAEDAVLDGLYVINDGYLLDFIYSDAIDIYIDDERFQLIDRGEGDKLDADKGPYWDWTIVPDRVRNNMDMHVPIYLGEWEDSNGEDKHWYRLFFTNQLLESYYDTATNPGRDGAEYIEVRVEVSDGGSRTFNFNPLFADSVNRDENQAVDENGDSIEVDMFYIRSPRHLANIHRAVSAAAPERLFNQTQSIKFYRDDNDGYRKELRIVNMRIIDNRSANSDALLYPYVWADVEISDQNTDPNAMVRSPRSIMVFDDRAVVPESFFGVYDAQEIAHFVGGTTPVYREFLLPGEGGLQDRPYKNYVMSVEAQTGLFEHIEAGSFVRNLALLNSTFKGWGTLLSGQSVGSIAGRNNGVIENCQVSGDRNNIFIIAENPDNGSIVNRIYGGGIVGYNQTDPNFVPAGRSGVVRGVYLNSTYTEDADIVEPFKRVGAQRDNVTLGGLIGRNEGLLENAYTTAMGPNLGTETNPVRQPVIGIGADAGSNVFYLSATGYNQLEAHMGASPLNHNELRTAEISGAGNSEWPISIWERAARHNTRYTERFRGLAYHFPKLIDMDHHYDWPFLVTTLQYYERYDDYDPRLGEAPYGYYFFIENPEEEAIDVVNTLSYNPDRTVIEEGYLISVFLGVDALSSALVEDIGYFVHLGNNNPNEMVGGVPRFMLQPQKTTEAMDGSRVIKIPHRELEAEVLATNIQANGIVPVKVQACAASVTERVTEGGNTVFEFGDELMFNGFLAVNPLFAKAIYLYPEGGDNPNDPAATRGRVLNPTGGNSRYAINTSTGLFEFTLSEHPYPSNTLNPFEVRSPRHMTHINGQRMQLNTAGTAYTLTDHYLNPTNPAQSRTNNPAAAAYTRLRGLYYRQTASLNFHVGVDTISERQYYSYDQFYTDAQVSTATVRRAIPPVGKHVIANFSGRYDGKLSGDYAGRNEVTNRHEATRIYNLIMNVPMESATPNINQNIGATFGNLGDRDDVTDGTERRAATNARDVRVENLEFVDPQIRFARNGTAPVGRGGGIVANVNFGVIDNIKVYNENYNRSVFASANDSAAVRPAPGVPATHATIHPFCYGGAQGITIGHNHGGIAAISVGTGSRISNCVVGTIADSAEGNANNITRVTCHSGERRGTEAATSRIGGIVGYAYGDTDIIACVNIAMVHGRWTSIHGSDGVRWVLASAGGIAGMLGERDQNTHTSARVNQFTTGHPRASASSRTPAVIVGCYNAGSIELQVGWVGGITGFCANDSEIVSSYNTGRVNIWSDNQGRIQTLAGPTSNLSIRMGGIIGEIENETIVRNNYNIGYVSARPGAGGSDSAAAIMALPANGANILFESNFSLKADLYAPDHLVGIFFVPANVQLTNRVNGFTTRDALQGAINADTTDPYVTAWATRGTLISNPELYSQTYISSYPRFPAIGPTDNASPPTTDWRSTNNRNRVGNAERRHSVSGATIAAEIKDYPVFSEPGANPFSPYIYPQLWEFTYKGVTYKNPHLTLHEYIDAMHEVTVKYFEEYEKYERANNDENEFGYYFIDGTNAVRDTLYTSLDFFNDDDPNNRIRESFVKRDGYLLAFDLAMPTGANQINHGRSYRVVMTVGSTSRTFATQRPVQYRTGHYAIEMTDAMTTFLADNPGWAKIEVFTENNTLAEDNTFNRVLGATTVRNLYFDYGFPKAFEYSVETNGPEAKTTFEIRTGRHLESIGRLNNTPVGSAGNSLSSGRTFNQEIDIELNRDLYSDYADFNHDAALVAGEFRGIYDGRFRTISNLYIDGHNDTNVGLFDTVGSAANTGPVANNGRIMNFKIDNADLKAAGSSRMGTVAAYNYGTITNVAVTGSTLMGRGNETVIGGIVGSNMGPSGTYETVATEQAVIRNVYFVNNKDAVTDHGARVSITAPIMHNFRDTNPSPASIAVGAMGGISGENKGLIAHALYIAKAPSDGAHGINPISGRVSGNDLIKEGAIDTRNVFFLAGHGFNESDSGTNMSVFCFCNDGEAHAIDLERCGDNRFRSMTTPDFTDFAQNLPTLPSNWRTGGIAGGTGWRDRTPEYPYPSLTNITPPTDFPVAEQPVSYLLAYFERYSGGSTGWWTPTASDGMRNDLEIIEVGYGIVARLHDHSPQIGLSYVPRTNGELVTYVTGMGGGVPTTTHVTPHDTSFNSGFGPTHRIIPLGQDASGNQRILVALPDVQVNGLDMLRVTLNNFDMADQYQYYYPLFAKHITDTPNPANNNIFIVRAPQHMANISVLTDLPTEDVADPDVENLTRGLIFNQERSLNFYTFGLSDAVVTGRFMGTYVGGGYAVHNIAIESNRDNIGLFAYNMGTISNLVLEFGTGRRFAGGSNVGGLAGTNSGGILDVTVLSTDAASPVHGMDRVGGIAGFNTPAGVVNRALYLAPAPDNGVNIFPIVGNNPASGVTDSFYLAGDVSSVNEHIMISPQNSLLPFDYTITQYNNNPALPALADGGMPKTTEQMRLLESWGIWAGQNWKLHDEVHTHNAVTTLAAYPYPFINYEPTSWPVATAMLYVAFVEHDIVTGVWGYGVLSLGNHQVSPSSLGFNIALNPAVATPPRPAYYCVIVPSFFEGTVNINGEVLDLEKLPFGGTVVIEGVSYDLLVLQGGAEEPPAIITAPIVINGIPTNVVLSPTMYPR